MAEHEKKEQGEAVEGPDGAKLAPEGNSNARLFVPPDQDEKREERELDEPDSAA